MRNFIGVTFEDLDGSFIATFPDLLECVEFGETAEQASALASAAFPALLRDAEERSQTLIEPSTMTEIAADPQNRGSRTFEAVA